MLLKVNATRLRARVSDIDDQGQIGFFIYPELTGSVSMKADSRMVNDDLNYSALKVGEPFDALVIRYTEGNLSAKGKVIYKYQAIAIEKPQIHPFDIKTLHPEGLTCLTAIVNQAADGVYGAVTAKKTCNGQESNFRITTLTKMFQAQQNDEQATRIYKGLKPGDSVNIWVDPKSESPVKDALFLSVNYR